MRWLGFEVTRSSRVNQRIDMAVHLARVENIKNTILNTREIRELIARVGRSAAKDWIAQHAEQQRERFEADPLFTEWAAQRREHDLAEAEVRHDPSEGGGYVRSSARSQSRPVRDEAGDGHEDPDSL